MDDITDKVLIAIQDFLERLTKADNLTSDQLTEAFMAATAIAYQRKRMAYPADKLTEARKAEEALVATLPVKGQHKPRNHDAVWTQGVGAALSGALETEAHSDDPVLRQKVRDFVVALNEPMDPAVSGGTQVTYTSGRGDTRESDVPELQIDITAEGLEAWLHETGNEPASTRVTNVKRLMGGYSKATYIVKMGTDAGEKTVVIRKDGYGLPTGPSIVGEFPVLQEMERLGIPAPRPLWIEPGETPFATAFMGVSFASGRPANHCVPQDVETRAKWAVSIAQAVAKLHRETAQPDADVREELLGQLAFFEGNMFARERSPHPGLIIGIDWLRKNIDTLKGRPAVRVHADLGFHNFMMRDDGLDAMLDWEFSHVGDPVEDLSSMIGFMNQIDSWDLFYKTYQDACGFTMNKKVEAYLTVWRETRNMITCLGSLNSLLLPPVKDVPLTVAGTIYIPKYEVGVLDAITEAEKI
jgi:aminoglycoside phosphotransferase (APT) family kinase protein